MSKQPLVIGHGQDMTITTAQLLTVEAVARMAACSTATVKRADDELRPARDSSNRRLYSFEQARAWAERRLGTRADTDEPEVTA